MYQSIRILQLVCPVYRAPHSHLHDKKGHLRLVTKVPKRFSSKLNHKGKGHVLPTLVQFHVRMTSIVKVTFNKNSGGRLAPDTHFTAASWKGSPAYPESAHQLVLLDTCPTLCKSWKLFKMHVTSYKRQHFWEPAVSCASWMGRTLLFRVASGTKLLGVSSNHDLSGGVNSHRPGKILNNKCEQNPGLIDARGF